MRNLIKIKDKLPRTAVELFEILPEGILCEVIENTLYMTPAPDFFHQKLSIELSALIFNHVKSTDAGECVAAPMDVYLDDANAYQPDILFIDRANLGIIKDGKIKGAPNMIIEILSAGSERHDKIIKRAVYERNGVKECFIVEPSTKEVIAYYLKNKKFEKQATKKGKLKSGLLKKTFSF
ncbi:MAG: Uma2 family endonuclease [Ferruginibacter sp.]|nr:Uma2 family endonuclease [Ferruginibacter sp.]